MELYVFLTVFFLAAFLYWIFQRLDTKIRQLPPGPFRWPLVGSLVRVVQECPGYPHIAFTKLYRIYGDIVYFQMGIKPIVTINGYNAVKEVLKSDDWLDRLDDKWLLRRTFDKRQGIIFGDLQMWRANRRFTMKKLRDYGYGKTSVDTFLRRELEETFQTLEDSITSEGGVIEPCEMFQIPAVNIIWTLVSGTRFSHTDPQATKLAKYIEDFSHEMSLGTGLLSMYPFLFDWAPTIAGVPKLEETHINFHKFLGSLIDEFRSKSTCKTEPENFIEVFLQHIDAIKNGVDIDTGNIDRNIFTDENLISILYDLFWAGSETTSSWLAYAILWLIVHPDVQKRMRSELVAFEDQHGHPPAFGDRSYIPYTRATMLEIGRRSTIAPQGPRKVFKDTQFHGYTVPKNTNVIINYHSVLMDEGYWGDPENFRPERFLDSSGQLKNEDHLIQFALGRRNCLGEMIAETTSFFYLTQMVRHYEFLPIKDHHYDVSSLPGLVVSPRPYQVIVQPLIRT